MSRMRAEEKAMNTNPAPAPRAFCVLCTATLMLVAAVTDAAAGSVSFGSELPAFCISPVPAHMYMPDPAAAYCEELGYEYRVVDEPGGQRGVCLLPDGREVDAWDFFRAKVAQEYSYCARQGYEIRTRVTDHGSYTSECAVCVSETGEDIGTVAELMALDFNPVPAIDGRSTGATEDATGAGAGRAARGTSRYVPRHVAVPFGGNPPSGVLPAKFDWRTLDGCTAVKAQGSCGSCWAFSTVGALECNILIRDGVEVDLSEQWLVSCNQHDWNCGGGGFAHRYHMLTRDPCGGTGAVLESDFPYVAWNAPCECPYPHHYNIDGWGYVDPAVDIPDPELIKRAIFEHGPISVGVMANAAFSNYHGGVFTGSIEHDINHAVVLVGWDDNQGADGIWYLRNSWGTMWGEQGYMRIERGRNAVGWVANWVDYRDPIQIILDDDAPRIVEPGNPTPVAVRVETRTDSYMPGTAMLHHRLDGGGYDVSPLTPLGGGLYEATLPAAACGDTLEYFFSAAGLRFGSVYDPADPLSRPYTARVGGTAQVFHDSFESDSGWTVENDVELSGGAWERGVPAGGGDRSDPPTDYDGSGSCYLTGNTDGDSDVDSGWTRLISPVIDLSSGDDAVVTFAFWYRNDHGDNPNGDLLDVYFSDDGGASWVHADAVGPRSPLPVGWKRRTVVVCDHVEPTSTFRVAIEVADLLGGSLVEAGVDDFGVSLLSCGDRTCLVDDRQPSYISPSNQSMGEDAPVLLPNAPNPFNPSTVVRFHVPRPERVTLRILGPSGRIVRTLLEAEPHHAGEHSIVWDGRDDTGVPSASGVYFYRLEVPGAVLLKRMVLLK
jgi:putative hemolysin